MDIRHTHRIHVAENLTSGLEVTASPDQAHYLRHVLRMKVGESLRLFNGRDGEYLGTISAESKKGVLISIGKQLRPQSPEPDLWLCCAPIKKIHFDNMLEKATELGVSEIQPVLTERAQVRDINGDRLYCLCREAAEQSERLSIPAVGSPVYLSDLVDVFPQDRALIVCAEWGNAEPIHAAFCAPKLNMFKKAAVLVGPEGGFSGEELTLLRTVPQAFFVRLGPRILRADTAAISALACWQAIRGDWAS